jgi:hypothetical protein
MMVPGMWVELGSPCPPKKRACSAGRTSSLGLLGGSITVAVAVAVVSVPTTPSPLHGPSAGRTLHHLAGSRGLTDHNARAWVTQHSNPLPHASYARALRAFNGTCVGGAALHPPLTWTTSSSLSLLSSTTTTSAEGLPAPVPAPTPAPASLAGAAACSCSDDSTSAALQSTRAACNKTRHLNPRPRDAARHCAKRSKHGCHQSTAEPRPGPHLNVPRHKGHVAAPSWAPASSLSAQSWHRAWRQPRRMRTPASVWASMHTQHSLFFCVGVMWKPQNSSLT